MRAREISEWRVMHQTPFAASYVGMEANFTVKHLSLKTEGDVGKSKTM